MTHVSAFQQTDSFFFTYRLLMKRCELIIVFVKQASFHFWRWLSYLTICIGSNNGLALNRPQAITGTNADPSLLTYICGTSGKWVNTLRPRQNGRHFADDIFKCISLNENVWISIEISLKFVHSGSINNNPTLFQIMAWRRPGDKPLSETMMIS